MNLHQTASACALCALFLPDLVASAEPAVVTITGEISNLNHGPRNDFDDAMFKHLDVDCVRGRTVTLAEIKSLPQQRLELNFENWLQKVGDEPYLCEGPTLTAVLALAGSQSPRILTRALDGFAWPFDKRQVDFDAVLVGHTLEGRPLAIGGPGPLMRRAAPRHPPRSLPRVNSRVVVPAGCRLT